jgi:hypothetical protein
MMIWSSTNRESRVFLRWGIGLILGVGLVAGQPSQPRTQAWVLALDSRGAVVGDLKPEEIQVKVDGKPRPVIEVKTPAQTADAAQSWVMVFEPIRDTSHRALAFLAAADFLTKVPEGDRVLIVARGKDSLKSLMPGFSVRRGLWAEALAKVPDMLPESLVGSPPETLQGEGFQASFTDTSDGPAGQEAVAALLTRFRNGASGWAGGRIDMKGVRVIDRLDFNDYGFVMGFVAAIERESRAMESVFDVVAPVPGQKHVVVFSRCESDDMCHPSVTQAMNKKFKRVTGDMGGPAEIAALAFRDMSILQSKMKARAVADGLTVFSVAGSGQNILGHVGSIATGTGGFAFPLASPIDTTFGQSIQVFGFRYLVQWTEGGTSSAPAPLDISTSRPGVRLLVQATR